MTRHARRMPVEHEWYKRAVFYEMLVQAGYDANGDGYGDLPGLTSKLDYLRWLGIDCLWLPPFYDSPRRDGGYDIRDYYTISPEYGTLDDFVTLLDEAHARGIRVITDLVLNHTSDTHLWFQSSRSDPTGPHGDFYVWADDESAYRDVRVIFSDTEKSNWTFDPVRGQYYWHRLYEEYARDPLGERWYGHVPVELTGSVAFPPIGRRPCALTLPEYGSYWFWLVPARRPAARGPRPREERSYRQPVPALDHGLDHVGVGE